jgi:hypothetical protein
MPAMSPGLSSVIAREEDKDKDAEDVGRWSCGGNGVVGREVAHSREEASRVVLH